LDKAFKPKTEFTNGYLNSSGVRIFPSIDELSKKYSVSRSSLFKRCQKEGWHAERLQFQKKLAAELSKQAIASSINKAETIDISILRVAARGLQLVEEKLNGDSIEVKNTNPELKHLLGTATEAQRLAQDITVHLDTFADGIIDEEGEKALRNVIAILDEAAAIKSSQGTNIRQQRSGTLRFPLRC